MTDKIQLYTDGGNRNTGNVAGGSVRETDKAAWAALLLYQGQHKILTAGELGRTNNYMELTAVIQGLTAIKKPEVPVQVYSDSAYVINGLQQKWYLKWQKNNWRTQGKPVKNAELWRDLIAQVQRFPAIEFIKVKGHATNKYNNLVDETLNETMDKL